MMRYAFGASPAAACARGMSGMRDHPETGDRAARLVGSAACGVAR